MKPEPPPPPASLLEPWEYRDTESFLQASQLHARSVAELVAPSATRHDAAFELHACVVDIHRMMREEYLRTIHSVGRNIYPLIVARDNEPDTDRSDRGRQGLGGTYTLYLEGETHSVRPTPRAYELLKCLAHMPLGLFTLVSPYFLNPTATSWTQPLEAFHRKVQVAQAAFEAGGPSLQEEHRTWAWNMLELSEAYIQQTQQKRSVTVADFESYTARMRPFIRQSMDAAGRLQVDAVTTAMLRWKQMLGPVEWKKLYVIVPTIWPVAEHNPRWQIFRSLMDPEEVELRLLGAEGIQTEEEARTLLGRIVADRLAGRLVFGIEDERARRMTQCLSSPTDVVSDSARQALLEYAERSGCPMQPWGKK
jgi:hypothetical protein